MAHNIIALGRAGLKTLKKFHGLLEAYNLNTTSDSFKYFYLNSDQSEESPAPVLSSNILNIQDYISQEITAQNQQEITTILPKAITNTDSLNHTRRMTALNFRHALPHFIEILNQNTKCHQPDDLVFELVLDISDIGASGCITDLLLELRRQYAYAKLCVFIQYPCDLDKTHEKHSANIYATLLELNLLSKHNITYCENYLFSYHINEVEHGYLACAYALYNAMTNTLPSVGLRLPEGVKQRFFHTQEIAFQVSDTPTLSNVHHYITVQILYKILQSDSKSISLIDRPEWITQLFSDPYWGLHPNFLSRQVMANQVSLYPSLEQEWEEFSKKVINQLHLMKDREWAERYGCIHEYFDDKIKYHFRGKGVYEYYAVDMEQTKHSAMQITEKIEQALLNTWLERCYPLQHNILFLNDIIETVQGYLSMCRSKQKIQEDFHHNYASQIQTIDNKRNQTSRVAIRRFDKQLPTDNITWLYRDSALTLSHALSMKYAVALLEQVILNLKTLITTLENSIGQFDQNVEHILVKNLQTTPEFKHTTRLLNEHVFTLNINQDIGNTLKIYQKSIFKLTTQIRCIIPKKLRGITHFQVALDFLQSQDFYQFIWQTTKNNVQEIPELSTTVRDYQAFGRSILLYLNQKNHSFWQILDNLSLPSLNTVEEAVPFPQNIWLMPKLEPELQDSLLNLLRNKKPNSQFIITEPMLIKRLILRQVNLLPTDGIEGFTNLSQSYNHYLYTHSNGVNHSILLHTQNTTPYPEYENQAIKTKVSPAQIRQLLLVAQASGLLIHDDDKGVILQVEDYPVVLGEDFTELPKTLSARNYQILERTIGNTHLPTKSQATVELSACLKELKEYYQMLSAKKNDLSSAGEYMLWAQSAKKALSWFVKD